MLVKYQISLVKKTELLSCPHIWIVYMFYMFHLS